MKAKFAFIRSQKCSWAEQAIEVYQKKISFDLPLEILPVKSVSAPRDQATSKVKQEEEKIFKVISDKDYLCLFDQRGRKCTSSEDHAKQIQKALESGKSQIVFLIGGAFGVSEKLRKRANTVLSLSPLVMSHSVAQVVALEQIYRSLSILKSRPYHNP